MGDSSAAQVFAVGVSLLQNSGARTGEQSLCRIDSAAKRAGKRLGGFFGDSPQARGRDRIGGKTEYERGELIDVADAPLALRGKEHAENLPEVLRIRTCYHGGIELGSLERGLPAMLHQASPQEGEIRCPIEEAELAHRVCDVDRRVGRGKGRRRAPAHRKPAGGCKAVALCDACAM